MKNLEREIYSTFSNISSSIGYSEIHGRIIAALLVKGKRLSLQELAKETGYSISTLSLSLDLLEVLGMIRKIKKAGDRKLYVEIQGDLLEGLKKAFVIRIQKSVDDTLNQFEKYKKVKDKNTKNTLNILEKEVQKLNKYINLLTKLKLP